MKTSAFPPETVGGRDVRWRAAYTLKKAVGGEIQAAGDEPCIVGSQGASLAGWRHPSPGAKRSVVKLPPGTNLVFAGTEVVGRRIERLGAVNADEDNLADAVDAG